MKNNFVNNWFSFELYVTPVRVEGYEFIVLRFAYTFLLIAILSFESPYVFFILNSRRPACFWSITVRLVVAIVCQVFLFS